MENCVLCEGGAPCRRFENQTLQCGTGPEAISVPGMSGWRCERMNDEMLDPDCAHVFAAVGDALIYRERERKSGISKAAEQLLSLGWKWNGERWDHPSANEPRTLKFVEGAMWALRTGWNEQGMPLLVISENPDPGKEPQGADLNLRMPVGAESVVIEVGSLELLIGLVTGLQRIAYKMLEQAKATKQ